MDPSRNTDRKDGDVVSE